MTSAACPAWCAEDNELIKGGTLHDSQEFERGQSTAWFSAEELVGHLDATRFTLASSAGSLNDMTPGEVLNVIEALTAAMAAHNAATTGQTSGT